MLPVTFVLHNSLFSFPQTCKFTYDKSKQVPNFHHTRAHTHTQFGLNLLEQCSTLLDSNLLYSFSIAFLFQVILITVLEILCKLHQRAGFILSVSISSGISYTFHKFPLVRVNLHHKQPPLRAFFSTINP